MQTFQKPENALKRAEELQLIGQNEEALQILHSAIGHRTFRLQGWHILQEQIMLRYIEFCLYLEKLSLVKDGLHQYRIICQHGNIASLGKVITDFRGKAEEKVRIAKEAMEANKDKIEHEEIHVDPTEKIIMTSLDLEITGKFEKKLQNAFKICWETYKMILEILRATPKLEKAYHETARKALIFCKENNRLSEFKKLCELLRNHYSLILKVKHKPEFQSLLKIEYHLETKIIQLQTACELKTWKEASNIAEDIFNLNMHDYFYRCMRSSAAEVDMGGVTSEELTSGLERKVESMEEGSKVGKSSVSVVTSGMGPSTVDVASTTVHTTTSPAQMNERVRRWIAIFYERMAEVLFVYDSELFHGLAWLKYCFHLLNYKKTLTETERTYICTKSVLAVLSIPSWTNKKEGEDSAKTYEAYKKMSQILGHSNVPIKESLKNALKIKNILPCAEKCVQDLYNLMENQFCPLTLCLESEKLLKQIENTEYSMYIKKIKEVIFHKLIVQLSKVYSHLSIDYLKQHICPDHFICWVDAEKFLVDIAFQGDLEMRLDMAVGAIYFDSRKNYANQLNDPKEEHLLNLFTNLQQGMRMMNESIIVENEVECLNMTSLPYEEELERLERRNGVEVNIPFEVDECAVTESIIEKPIEDERVLKKIYDKIEEEHMRILTLNEENSRKRKEQLKRQREQELIQQKIRMEQKLLEEKLEKERKEEMIRKGEKLRLKEEKSKKKTEAAALMLEEIKKICASSPSRIMLKGKYLGEINIDDILNGYVDIDDIAVAQEKIRLKEKNEIVKIRRAEAKQVDHLFRAIRQKELEYLPKWSEDIGKEDTEILVHEQKLADEENKANIKAALQEKEEYLKYTKDIDEFREKEMKVRVVEFERNLKAQRERLYKALKEEKIQRARDRREKNIRKLKAEEERKRLEEEQQQLLKEEMERKKKLDEIARIQREKDLKIEMNLRKTKEALEAQARNVPEKEAVKEPPVLKEIVKEPAPKEPMKEIPREVPRDIHREVPREIHREVPREIHREVPREIQREVPREIHREVPREIHREVPREIPREITREKNKEGTKEGKFQVKREVAVEEEDMAWRRRAPIEIAEPPIDIRGPTKVREENRENDNRGRREWKLNDDDMKRPYKRDQVEKIDSVGWRERDKEKEEETMNWRNVNVSRDKDREREPRKQPGFRKDMKRMEHDKGREINVNASEGTTGRNTQNNNREISRRTIPVNESGEDNWRKQVMDQRQAAKKANEMMDNVWNSKRGNVKNVPTTNSRETQNNKTDSIEQNDVEGEGDFTVLKRKKKPIMGKKPVPRV